MLATIMQSSRKTTVGLSLMTQESPLLAPICSKMSAMEEVGLQTNGEDQDLVKMPMC